MSDDDWEETVTMLPEPSPAQGRIFGMRGRGFTPVEKFVGLSKNGNFKGENKENSSNVYHNNFERDSSNKNVGIEGSYIDVDNDRRSRRPGGRDENYNKSDALENKGNKREPYSKYIPKDVEDEDLFTGGISIGINFSKYDDIEVKVSGENIPKKIVNFESAGLNPLLDKNIAKCSYKKPTPIQKYALPIVMNGRDMMACAQTGSGKTAAFLIPTIHCMLERELGPIGDGRSASPQFLIVTPTRELAIQIYVETKKFTYGSSLKTEIVYGGTCVRYQLNRVKMGCNILIGTPGRLKDFVQRRALVLREIRHFVIDEADEMLDNNFLVDIESFLTHQTMNKTEDVQILMFSATFPEKIQNLAAKFLKNYLFLTVGIVGGACADVEQKFYLVSKFDKRPKLIELLEQHGSGKTVVFVRQKRTADIIAAFLSEKDYLATSMHGDREQVLREEALNDFKSGKMDLLVATAVAARGLDIKNVSHVINFDLPHSIDEYVHRIGRTGRVGNKGLASSFYCPKTDSALAPALVRILTQAQQEVPEFLQTREACNSWAVPSSYFGGKDVRRRGESRHVAEVDDAPLEIAPTYEEEVW